MMTRKERRVAEHAARKAARKAGFPTPTPANPANDSVAPAPISEKFGIDEEPVALPKPPISPARLEANRQTRNSVRVHEVMP